MCRRIRVVPFMGGEGGPHSGHDPVLIPLPPSLISATADTAAERDYWQSFVWPAMASLCDELGLTWEVVDLRCVRLEGEWSWGDGFLDPPHRPPGEALPSPCLARGPSTTGGSAEPLSALTLPPLPSPPVSLGGA